jgi:hypothetical protein
VKNARKVAIQLGVHMDRERKGAHADARRCVARAARQALPKLHVSMPYECVQWLDKKDYIDAETEINRTEKRGELIENHQPRDKPPR